MKNPKTILITGGTGALGQALVRVFLELGARVFFTYVTSREKAGSLEQLGARGIVCDFCVPAEVEQLARQLERELVSLDILIHNAALVADQTVQNLSLEAWERVLQVDLKAPMALTYALRQLLMKAPSPSRVFFITSRVGLRGGFGQANYAAAKDGLMDFAQYLAHAWADEGVLINCVNPGFMISNMTQSLPEKVLRRNQQESLRHCYSDPREVALFIAHLASENGQHVSGQVFHFESRFSG